MVVALIGNGQEINTGEAGIAEWLGSVERRFPEWEVYVSPELGQGDATVAANALFAAITAAASCGAVNAMHDSMTPLGGGVALANMMLYFIFTQAIH